MPSHLHQVSPGAQSGDATDSSPQANVPASIPAGGYASNANTTMAVTPSGLTGGSQPHQNTQPYLVLNFCIAIFGIFPSRN
jgi:microcystin-dependent protein